MLDYSKVSWQMLQHWVYQCFYHLRSFTIVINHMDSLGVHSPTPITKLARLLWNIFLVPVRTGVVELPDIELANARLVAWMWNQPKFPAQCTIVIARKKNKQTSSAGLEPTTNWWLRWQTIEVSHATNCATSPLFKSWLSLEQTFWPTQYVPVPRL